MSESLGVDARPVADASPGALLKRERESRALTVQQAAESLHLDPWILEAIEANRFQSLGAPVYARGHLRKYAVQLGLSPEDILERYEALQDRPVLSDPIPAALADPIRAPRRSLRGPAWTATAIIVVSLLIWGAYEFWQKRELREAVRSAAATVQAPALASPELSAPTSEQSSAQPISEPEQPVVQPQAGQAPVAEAASSVAQAPATPSTSAPSTTAQVPSAAAPQPVAGQIELRLEYSGDSWTEVTDSTGARLMYGTGASGNERTLRGVPPVQVTLGSVSAVRMQINGESVPVPRREGREFSRFTIGADGNLR